MNSGEPPLEQAEDAESRLVERAKERSPSAWAEIYDDSYPKVYRYCYARTGNQAVAADLASSVFLEALEGIDRYVYRGRPLLAWLYRIARNVVSDHLRAQQRESDALKRRVTESEPHDPGPAEQVESRRDIWAALDQLTEDQRQVIIWRYFASFTTAEIAGAMERSKRAVYSLEVRALVALRKLADL